MLGSDVLGHDLRTNASLSTLHSHGPFDIKLMQYDLPHGGSGQGPPGVDPRSS